MTTCDHDIWCCHCGQLRFRFTLKCCEEKAAALQKMDPSFVRCDYDKELWEQDEKWRQMELEVDRQNE